VAELEANERPLLEAREVTNSSAARLARCISSWALGVPCWVLRTPP